MFRCSWKINRQSFSITRLNPTSKIDCKKLEKPDFPKWIPSGESICSTVVYEQHLTCAWQRLKRMYHCSSKYISLRIAMHPLKNKILIDVSKWPLSLVVFTFLFGFWSNSGFILKSFSSHIKHHNSIRKEWWDDSSGPQSHLMVRAWQGW